MVDQSPEHCTLVRHRWRMVLEQCRRINVTGNAGAGKTTTAARLGELLGLPVYALDPVVWQSGWRKTPMSIRLPMEEELISRPTWVIDGVSSRVREAADLILFLDVPTRVCFARATVRMLRHLRRQRPEFPEGCPEWRIYPRLARTIWRFPSKAGLEIRSEAKEDPRYRIVSSPDELELLLPGRARVDQEVRLCRSDETLSSAERR